MILVRENERGNITTKSIVDVAIADMSLKITKGFKQNFDHIYRVSDENKKHIEEDEAALEAHLINYDKLKFTCDMNFSVMVKQEEMQKTIEKVNKDMMEMRKELY